MLPSEEISETFNLLSDRLDKLKTTYNFEPELYSITEEQREKLRVFEILAHAELEDYFESVATILIDYSKEIWDKSKQANYNLAALFIFNESFSDANVSIETKVNNNIKKYKDRIKKNNGIKRNNIFNLFSPLGYTKDEFSELFLADLDSLGQERGKFAHLSGSKIYRTVQYTSKENAYQRIENIKSEIINSNDGFQKIILGRVN